ncbi:MAG: hypothetical protein DMD81_01875 [Candidatus Rokuibacteriota bacterium]|nr:MAG: hypothetical protein DMD81_01875 [Candidatus Rokubacteria bacterium]
MGATFIITLREAFEAALLLGIVYTYLDKVGGRRHFHWVTLGAVVGGVASLLAGIGVTLASGPLLDLGPDVVATAVIFVAVIVLTWHGYWMRQNAREIRGDVQARIEEAQATSRLWVVGLIAFTGVFREGAETVLFLWGLASQASITEWSGIAGGVLGVGSAAVLGWLIFHGGQRVSVQLFFTITSVVLLAVAAGLLSTGVGRLEALGVLPSSPVLWDTSSILDQGGTVGSFLGGLLGYRARPSLSEMVAYVTYLVVAGLLFFRPFARTPAHPIRDRKPVRQSSKSSANPSAKSSAKSSEGALTPS